MRGGVIRRRHDDDEEESAFVSMTDMTVGFLFIVILLLAFFASQYNDTDKVPRSQYEAAAKQRDEALLKIAELYDQIKDLSDEKDKLKAENAQKNRKIVDLDRTIDQLRRELDRLKYQRDEALSTIAKLADQIKNLSYEKGKLKAESAQKDRRIVDLDRTIDNLRRELDRLKKLQGDPLEIYSSQSAQARRNIIQRLVEAVQQDIRDEKVEGLSVAISAQGDALRFQGQGLFASNSTALSGAGLKIVRLLGEHLRRELPCFTIGEASSITNVCNPGISLIETVQVEGHADSDGTYETNLPLSAVRAASALSQMVDRSQPQSADILLFKNLLEQPVMAVAAYSSSRPIAPNDTKQGKAANRRIDLRFIMYVPPGLEFIPQTVEDLAAISEKLRNPTTASPAP